MILAKDKGFLPYRAWAEINLDNVDHNFNEIRKLVGNCQIACVLKGNAYGHGAIQFAKTLAQNGATYFITNTAEEAIQLRKHGLTQPILVLCMVSPAVIPELVDMNITVTIGNSAMARNYASVLGRRRLRIHLKVETGLNRTGFSIDEFARAYDELKHQDCFLVEGIYTHFAVAEDDDLKDFTQNQLSEFVHLLQENCNNDSSQLFLHIANSASIMNYPASYGTPFNLVRPGMLLCGINPAKQSPIHLKPVLELHAQITQIKEVEPGEGVSYGFLWRADQKTRVATASIGYADGLQRALTQRLEVIINGQKVPQIGRIAMDSSMYDISMIPEAKVGDHITIIGQNGELFNGVEKVAGLVATIPNEFLSGISMRVPRVFHRNGAVVEIANYLV